MQGHDKTQSSVVKLVLSPDDEAHHHARKSAEAGYFLVPCVCNSIAIHQEQIFSTRPAVFLRICKNRRVQSPHTHPSKRGIEERGVRGCPLTEAHSTSLS